MMLDAEPNELFTARSSTYSHLLNGDAILSDARFPDRCFYQRASTRRFSKWAQFSIESPSKFEAFDRKRDIKVDPGNESLPRGVEGKEKR